MPIYDFHTLSPTDFEYLSKDILNAVLATALQRYAPGRDQGIDLREITKDGSIIVAQCKHYIESSWSTFMRAVRDEVTKGERLHATRYLFTTSRDLTPMQQDQVVQALSGLGVTHEDIWGRARLNDALADHPEVEKRHIKLWLTSAGVLQTLLESGQWQRGEATLDHVRDQAKLWVRTPEFSQVMNVLRAQGVCIVHGPPGSGKTFLAEMALLSAAADGWEISHVSNDIDHAWNTLRNNQVNQLFYFDDFLGETDLQVSKNEPTNIATFINRIRRLRDHKRLIITTREQIFYKAASGYDRINDIAAEIGQIGVRIGRHSARIKSEILFNHLYFSGIPTDDRNYLAIDNRVISIVQHPSYSPRLILGGLRSTDDESADAKLEAIKNALDHPDKLWETSFRNLPSIGQQVLLTMATLPAKPWKLEVIHGLITGADPLSWRPALRILEPTWLAVTGPAAPKYIALASPSCRDYLLGVLDDATVAGHQIEQVQLLAQVRTLTWAAGLLPSKVGLTQRPELAHELRKRRIWLADCIRGFVEADLTQASPSQTACLIQDTATLLSVYGTEADSSWLLDRTSKGLDADGEQFDFSAADGFSIAQALTSLNTNTPEHRTSVTDRLLLRSASAIAISRDLDAYEALPRELTSAPIREAALRRAKAVLAEEMDDLLYNAVDSDAIRIAAAEIEQRAEWYGLDVNIGPLLDRVNDLVPTTPAPSPWPEIDNAPGDSESDDFESIRRTFSRFAN